MHANLTSSRIVVAVDGMSKIDILCIAGELEGRVWGFKVNDALMEHGVQIIEMLKNYGNVFADPKLFDIPNIVGNQVDCLVKAGADLISVHASGGVEMMRKAVKHGGERMVAITVLTSMPVRDMESLYNIENPAHADPHMRRNLVKKLADLARQANMHSIVCSSQDIPFIPPGFRIICPEICFQGDDLDAKEVEAAHLVVIGKSITRATSPIAVVEKIKQLLGER